MIYDDIKKKFNSAYQKASKTECLCRSRVSNCLIELFHCFNLSVTQKNKSKILGVCGDSI